MIIRKQLLLFAPLLMLFSCTTNSKDYALFDNLENTDTLMIEAYIADCGEWGGHNERFDVYRKKDNTLWVHYSKDSINCSDPAMFNRRIIENWTKKLNDKYKLFILNYIHKILEFNNSKNGDANSGNLYIVKKNHGELYIEYGNTSKSVWSEFENLKMELR